MTNESDIEVCCAFLVIQNKKLFIICIYIPPGSSIEVYNKCYQTILYISNMIEPDDHLIIMGDFNLPQVSWLPDVEDPNILLPHFESNNHENVFF